MTNFRTADNPGDASKQATVLSAVATFCKQIRLNVDRGRNVVLFGPPGTGKDHLLVSVIHAAVGEFVDAKSPEFGVRWTNGIDLYSRMRDVIDSEEKTEASEVRSWVAPRVLYLSDPIPPFGPLTPFQKAYLLQIVDARYRNYRPTYISLNVTSKEDAAERMSPQVLDRLKHGALVCWCNWPSYREPEEAL